MDQLPFFDYVKLSVPGIVTAINVSENTFIFGLESGEILLADTVSGKLINNSGCKPLKNPVSLISSSYGSFCYSSTVSGEMSVMIDRSECIHLSPVPSEYLPIHAIAMSPEYTCGSRRIALAGGNCPDIVVLSQEGPPFPSVSVSKDATSRGPIDHMRWQQDFLVWSGSEMGVKILNTKTGQRVAHIQLFGSINFSFDGNFLVILNNLDLLVAELVAPAGQNGGRVCEIKSRSKLDSREFVSRLKKTSNHEWWDAVMEKSDKKKIAGFALFDTDDAFSVSLLTISADNRLVHSIIDSKKSDIYVSDLISEDVKFDSVLFESFSGCSAIAYGPQVILARRRTVSDHCHWLIQQQMFVKAVKLSQMSNDTILKDHVFSTCLGPLITENQEFSLVAKFLTPDPPVPWSKVIEYFVCFPTGPVLAESLRSLVKLIPYAPKHSTNLPQCDYDTVIDAILRNHEYSCIDLLEIVRTWPHSVFSSDRLRDRLIDLVDEDFSLNQDQKDRYLTRGVAVFPGDVDSSPSVTCIALALTLKTLFETLGEYNESLSILLRLRCVEELFTLLANRVVESEQVRHWFDINLDSLFQVDAIKTAQFTIKNMGIFPVASVLGRLVNQPFLTHIYFRELFAVSPEATAGHQDNMIDSFISFDVVQLRKFLETAKYFNVDTAVVTVRNARMKSSSNDHLIECEALLLWRTQRPVEAIDLLLNVAHEIRTVVAFACEANDPKLWDAILSKVRQNEPELLVPLLRALLDLEGSFCLPQNVWPDVILRQALFPHNIRGLIPLIDRIIREENTRNRIISKSLGVMVADWRGERKVWSCRSKSSIVRIDPTSAICSVCQLRLCAPPPGDDRDSESFLNAVGRISEKVPVCSRTGSALFVVISGTELVHSKCLVRTCADFPRT